MTKDEALAWVEADVVVTAELLTARREAYPRESHATACGVLDDEAADALAARVRGLEGRTCDTCDNQRVDEGDPKSPWCRYLTRLGGGKAIYCYDIDGGCNAWKGKATP